MMSTQSFLRSSRLISGLTLCSRVTGLVRDVVLAGWLGNNWVQDRLAYAFQIPQLFRRLFGEGALSAAFIPTLSENLAARGKERAGRLFSNVATLLAGILTILTLTILVVLLMIWVLGEQSLKRQFVLGLTALMTPYMIFVCLVALFSAMLNCFEKFGLPAFVPVILNFFQIGAVIVGRYFVSRWTDRLDLQVYTVGVAVVLAGIVQLWVMIRAVRRLGIRWRLDFSISDGDLRKMMIMLAPMVLGLGVLQFGAWLDSQIILSLSGDRTSAGFELFGRYVAYPLEEGSLAAVNFARRLYNFPLGVLAISLATAAFPLFSRYAAEGDMESLRSSVSDGLRIAIFEGLPCGLGLIVLAELIVRVVFERGNFSHDDTVQTAHILRMYSLGLWAYCAQHIIVRAFYSVKDTMTPLRVMMATLGLNVALNLTLLWIPSIGAGAFGISTSVMCSINVIILCVIFSRRFGGLGLRRILFSSVRVLAVSVLMLAAVYFCAAWLVDLSKYLQLMIALAVGVTSFAAGCYLFKVSELREVLGISR